MSKIIAHRSHGLPRRVEAWPILLIGCALFLQIDGVRGEQAGDSIVGWGHNDDGQCNVPSPNSDFVAVAAGALHSLGLKADGSIRAWGSNNDGQCNVPLPNSDFVDIAAGCSHWGQGHSLGLKIDGSIIAWGNNGAGQCEVPLPNTGFIAIAAGGDHSLALKSDGSIVAWGDNSYAQCDIPTPNSDFVAIAAGWLHSLGLKADGSITAWGRNNFGQANAPMPNSDFVAVAAGGQHSLALRADGSITAWGDSQFGMSDVPGSNDAFVAVAAGDSYSLGLKAQGVIVAWGNNYNGQCSVPTTNSDFVDISAGGWHGLGLKARVVQSACCMDQACIDLPVQGVCEFLGGTWHVGEECISFICPTLCGNGICDSSEDCHSCQPDCGCDPGYWCHAGSCEKRILGISVPAYWYTDYRVALPDDAPPQRRTECNDSLNHLHRDSQPGSRINLIAISPAWYMTALNANYINRDPDRTPSDEDIRRVIRLVRGKGWKVLLKPHIEVRDPTTGQSFSRTNIFPADFEVWFADYVDFIMTYAQIAKDENVEMFCVGTELSNTHGLDGTAHWWNIVDDIRGGLEYTGELTYAANYNEYDRVGIWSQLDYIGIDAYFRLTKMYPYPVFPDLPPESPETGPLIEAWLEHVENLETWRIAYPDKPVMFTEIGYRAVEHAHIYREPDDPPGDVHDDYLHKRCYDAALAVWESDYWGTMDWFAGMVFWAWSPVLAQDVMPDTPDTACYTNGYSPYNKPSAVSLGLLPAAPECVEIVVDAGTTHEEFYTVHPWMGQVRFTAEWHGAIGVTSLETPSGVMIDETTIDPDAYMVEMTGNKLRETFRIDSPEDGKWTIRLDTAAMRLRASQAVVVVTAQALPPTTDTDGDILPDAIDNCPLIPNLDQRDSDWDDVGNACECDFDDDGRVDLDDLNAMILCLTGPADPCQVACCDVDPVDDANVDLLDFSVLQRTFSAPQ